MLTYIYIDEHQPLSIIFPGKRTDFQIGNESTQWYPIHRSCRHSTVLPEDCTAQIDVQALREKGRKMILSMGKP